MLDSFVVDNGEQFGQPKDTSILLDDTVVILPQDQIRQVSLSVCLSVHPSVCTIRLYYWMTLWSYCLRIKFDR